MSASHGDFVWYELMTTDMKAAKAFYTKVIGWTCKDTEMPGMPYWIFSAGDAMTCGLMTIPDDAKKMGAPPNWSGYIGVDDVDASAAKLKKLGGNVVREPADIPNVGRFAVVTDPQGVYFQLFKWSQPGASEPPPQDAPGRVGWRELYAKDMEKIFPFYAEMFGWTKGETTDMGAMGKYQHIKHGGKDIGGMMTKPPDVPAAFWNYYINVGDIDAVVTRITSAGGKVVHGPMQVPGGHWIAHALDPQGAFFAVAGKRG